MRNVDDASISAREFFNFVRVSKDESLCVMGLLIFRNFISLYFRLVLAGYLAKDSPRRGNDGIDPMNCQIFVVLIGD